MNTRVFRPEQDSPAYVTFFGLALPNEEST